MHLAVPHEFESIIQLNNSADSGGKMIDAFDEMSEHEIRQLWKESYEKIDARTLHFQFLTSLRQFFRDKGLDLGPLLKEIFQAITARESGKIASQSSWEGSYWQLLHMIFAGFYLESNPATENTFLKDFFEIEIKVDVLLLRMVLDIVSKTLRQVDPCSEAFEQSNFLSQSQRFDRKSILEDIDKAENDHSTFPGGLGGGLLSGMGSGRGNFSPRDQSYDSTQAFANSVLSSRGKFSFQLDLHAAANSSRQDVSLAS